MLNSFSLIKIPKQSKGQLETETNFVGSSLFWLRLPSGQFVRQSLFQVGFGNADRQTYMLRLTVVCVRGVHNEVGPFFSTPEESFPQLILLLSQHKDGKRTQNIALSELYSAYWMTEVSVFVVVPPPMYMLYLVLIFDNIASPALSFSSSSGTWTPSSER